MVNYHFASERDNYVYVGVVYLGYTIAKGRLCRMSRDKTLTNQRSTSQFVI